MSNPDSVDEKIIEIIGKLTGRARKVCDYILINGAITTEVIANELGYEHPPRAIRGCQGKWNSHKNFNDKGIELNVPGAPKDAAEQEPTQGGETSQDVVDKTAASAAAGQLSQSQATPQI